MRMGQAIRSERAIGRVGSWEGGEGGGGGEVMVVLMVGGGRWVVREVVGGSGVGVVMMVVVVVVGGVAGSRGIACRRGNGKGKREIEGERSRIASRN